MVKTEIKIELSQLSIKFSERDLKAISDGQRIKKSGLSYIKHCGYVFKDYGEISITVFHPKYSFIDEAQTWNAKPLKFKINEKLFEIGPTSPLFVLLNEPIYRDSDWQYEFQNFASIKVTKTNSKAIKSDIIKALYYLNSHYLKKIGFVARIYQMEIIEDDPLNLWEISIQDIFKKVNRVRIINRDDFISLEPLILYNQAQTLKGDEKFIYLYRIMEFFMYRARIGKLNEMRFDNHVSDSLLLKIIDQKNEEMLLDNLINESLTVSQKKKIAGYAFKNKVIPEDNYKLISKSLYKYRNSIVHAKEQHIIDTRIPDPFIQNYDILPWIYIIDNIVIRCIRKYN